MFKVFMKHQIPNITHLYEGTGRLMLKLRHWLLRCVYCLPHRVGHLHQIWLWKYNFVSRRFFLKACFRATSDLSAQWTAKLEVSSADTYKKKITVQIERLASRRTMNPHRHTESEEKQLSILQRLAPPSGLIFVEWDSHSSGIMRPKHTSKPWRTT